MSHAPLPEFLLQQIDSAECKCFMGIFPELKRVWMTVDHRLFLWNFADTQQSDFFSFDSGQDVLLQCHLFTPKSNIFDGHSAMVQYLIALVTCRSVKLVGVSNFNDNFTVYNTDYECSTDGVVMLSSCSLPSGHLFLGGRDGHLYELVYEAEETWFSRRTQLKNHTKSSMSVFVPTFLNFSSGAPIIDIQYDADRMLLHTLSDKSDCNVYQIVYSQETPSDISSVKHLFSLNGADEAKRWAGRSLPQADKDSFRVLNLSVVKKSPQTGGSVALIAVTSKGYRIYFNIPGRFVSSVFQPDNISVAHVRALPSLDDERDMDALTLPMTEFDTSYCADGLFFAAGYNASTSNVLYTSCVDMGTIIKKRQFCEQANLTSGDQRVWFICETANDVLDDGKSVLSTTNTLNTLAAQLAQFPRMFLVLTNAGKNFCLNLINDRHPHLQAETTC